VLPSGLVSHNNIEQWFKDNEACFVPPICNKLMHKDQLTIMFVGGPNTRTDFHLDEGSEFFYQLKGNIELPTIQQGKRKLVKILEGQVFLLPSRVPHSPQRPETGSFGLVIERARDEGEKDGLRWYTDFETCEEILYEKFFHCGDLGRDLVPVVQAFKASEESKTFVPAGNVLPFEERPVVQDMSTEIPPPFFLADFLKENEEQLACGVSLPLFGTDHPDHEFTINVLGGPRTDAAVWEHETWLYQLRGDASVSVEGGAVTLVEGSCLVVQPNVRYEISRTGGSVGLVVTQDPKGNKATTEA